MRVLQVGGGLDFLQKSLDAEYRDQLRLQDLERHGAVMFPVLRQVHCGHAADAELSTDIVAVGQGSGKASKFVGHGKEMWRYPHDCANQEPPAWIRTPTRSVFARHASSGIQKLENRPSEKIRLIPVDHVPAARNDDPSGTGDLVGHHLCNHLYERLLSFAGHDQCCCLDGGKLLGAGRRGQIRRYRRIEDITTAVRRDQR